VGRDVELRLDGSRKLLGQHPARVSCGVVWRIGRSGGPGEDASGRGEGREDIYASLSEAGPGLENWELMASNQVATQSMRLVKVHHEVGITFTGRGGTGAARNGTTQAAAGQRLWMWGKANGIRDTSVQSRWAM
jgi:hypothetical protein